MARNPLLVYMIAKYVLPEASSQARELNRSEIFRIFVDRTLRGKLETSDEEFPLDFSLPLYRLVLQELAALATRPGNGGLCPEFEAGKRLKALGCEDLHLPALRTAFVLHFFDPQERGDFAFEPEAFREYLLAEWCTRQYLYTAASRKQQDRLPLFEGEENARLWLCRLRLRDTERGFLNDLYEELGGLCHQDRATAATVWPSASRASALT